MQQIKATVLADSTSAYTGVRAISYELEYPRFIHSEFMTHRQVSKNSASSRAIPTQKLIEQVQDNPAMPVCWGKNQSGMQAKEELYGNDLDTTKEAWRYAAGNAASFARILHGMNLHKQTTNRVLEPFQIMKVVCTATEWNNFFWLRDHADAQPEIKVLAEKMLEAKNKSKTTTLFNGEWHLPYLFSYRKNRSGKLHYSFDKDTDNLICLDDAVMLSVSLCAQTSYRNSNSTVEKAKEIYSRLVESEPCHASPTEHQLLSRDTSPARHDELTKQGWTHLSFRDGMWWSGNIRGFVQLRQLIPNNAKYG